MPFWQQSTNAGFSCSSFVVVVVVVAASPSSHGKVEEHLQFLYDKNGSHEKKKKGEKRKTKEPIMSFVKQSVTRRHELSCCYCVHVSKKKKSCLFRMKKWRPPFPALGPETPFILSRGSETTAARIDNLKASKEKRGKTHKRSLEKGGKKEQ